MQLEQQLVVSSTPHVRGKDTVQDIMLDVILALMPAAFAAVYFFGARALAVVLISVVSCVAMEGIYQKLTHRKVTISDLSAVVTGMLLAYCLPVTIPYWMIPIGAFVAIIVTKQLFGGIGQNFMNPALIGRAFLLAAFPTAMTTWAVRRMGLLQTDVITSATPLSAEFEGGLPSLLNFFLGRSDTGVAIGGCIGETCAAALLLGAIYLLLRRVITWHIPVAYLGTVAVLSLFLTPKNPAFAQAPVYSMLAGGVMLGAFFMATDYTTSPVTPVGQLIYGVGCGLLTCIIRSFGGYPEGVSYAILLMNVVTPLLDRAIRPRVFGARKGARQE